MKKKYRDSRLWFMPSETQEVPTWVRLFILFMILVAIYFGWISPSK